MGASRTSSEFRRTTAPSDRAKPPRLAHGRRHDRLGRRSPHFTAPVCSPLLPNRFASHSGGTWPVFYLVHGGFGTFVDWTESSDIADLACKRDVLVVMPDGGSLGFYTDWWARGGNKPGWETFHLVELRADPGARAGAPATGAHRRSRWGASARCRTPARHPGFFRAAASFSVRSTLLHPTVAPLFPGLYATWLLQTSSRRRSGTTPSRSSATRRHSAMWAAHTRSIWWANLRGTKLFVSCGNGQVGPLDPPGTDPSGPSSSSRPSSRTRRSLRAPRVSDSTSPSTSTAPARTRGRTGRVSPERAFPLLMRSIGARCPNPDDGETTRRIPRSASPATSLSDATLLRPAPGRATKSRGATHEVGTPAVGAILAALLVAGNALAFRAARLMAIASDAAATASCSSRWRSPGASSR